MGGYLEELRWRGVEFAVARLKSDLGDGLARADALDAFATRTFVEIDDGVEAYRSGGFRRPADR